MPTWSKGLVLAINGNDILFRQNRWPMAVNPFLNDFVAWRLRDLQAADEEPSAKRNH